jgi:hypothetical protein
LEERHARQAKPKWQLADMAIPASTARLDTLEFIDHTERSRLWANEFFGLNIPLSGEVAL